MYMSGQMLDTTTPAASSTRAAGVVAKRFATAGAAVNTHGTLTRVRPASASPCAMRSLHCSSCSMLICGHPIKHSLGLASAFFHTTG